MVLPSVGDLQQYICYVDGFAFIATGIAYG